MMLPEVVVGKRKEKKRPAELSAARLKKPVNPSVLGTPKQSVRTEKGSRAASGRRSEGRGHAPGGGRGGKTGG